MFNISGFDIPIFNHVFFQKLGFAKGEPPPKPAQVTQHLPSLWALEKLMVKLEDVEFLGKAMAPQHLPSQNLQWIVGQRVMFHPWIPPSGLRPPTSLEVPLHSGKPWERKPRCWSLKRNRVRPLSVKQIFMGNPWQSRIIMDYPYMPTCANHLIISRCISSAALQAQPNDFHRHSRQFHGGVHNTSQWRVTTTGGRIARYARLVRASQQRPKDLLCNHATTSGWSGLVLDAPGEWRKKHLLRKGSKRVVLFSQQMLRILKVAVLVKVGVRICHLTKSSLDLNPQRSQQAI